MTGGNSGSALRMAGGGILLSAAQVGGLYGGQWLDRRVGSAPVFLYLGVSVGAIGGITALCLQVLRAQRDEEEARQR